MHKRMLNQGLVIAILFPQKHLMVRIDNTSHKRPTIDNVSLPVTKKTEASLASLNKCSPYELQKNTMFISV